MSYRVPATAEAGTASSMWATSAGDSSTWSASSDSASCARVRASDGLGAQFRQTDRSHVAGLHEIRDGADSLLDGHGGIQAGWPVDVNVIDAEARQRVRQKVLHRCGPRVDAQPASVRSAQR